MQILPGTLVAVDAPVEIDRLNLGPSLIMVSPSQIISLRAGTITQKSDKKSHTMTLTTSCPTFALHDQVIGIIKHRVAEKYIVEIKAPTSASLSHYAFEGATKRNRPQLQTGDVVFGRITRLDKHLDPQMECFNSHTLISEGYGILKDGFLIDQKVSTAMIDELGIYFKFEVIIADNDRAWIKASSPAETLLLAQAITRLDVTDVESFVKQLKDGVDFI